MVLTVVRSEAGIVLRIATGPEGEALMDMAGSQDLDITDVVKQLKHEDVGVVLKLCRCRNEADTIASAQRVGLPYSCVTLEPVKPTPPKPTITKPAKPVRWGRCSYCGEEEEMLSVPGHMICGKCCQIELGRLRQKQVKEPDKGDM